MSGPRADYVERFHSTRPGITESVLRRSGTGGRDPYGWLLDAVPADGPVLDLGCGNAPLRADPGAEAPSLAGRAYLGVDTASGELRQAARAGRGPVVRARAERLPVPDAAMAVVVASMTLQVVRPLPEVLGEIRRVLASGGVLVATLPASGPLGIRGLPAVAGLIAALGRAPDYPNSAELGELAHLLAAAGFVPRSDTARCFRYRLDRGTDADLLLRSLYLPGCPPARQRLAGRYLRRLARLGVGFPVPIRRVVAVAAEPVSAARAASAHARTRPARRAAGSRRRRWSGAPRG